MISKLFKAYENAKTFLARRKAHNALLKELRRKRTILLVAGHHRAGFWHGRDTGATAFDTTEHLECENIVEQAQGILERDGFKSIVCPFDYDLPQKTRWVNQFSRNSVVLSVHLNAGAWAASGSETWYLSGSRRGAKGAKEIQKVLTRHLSLADRGVKGDLKNRHQRLGILRDTLVFGDEYLIEMGFITNAHDLEQVRTHGAQAIVDAAKAVF